MPDNIDKIKEANTLNLQKQQDQDNNNISNIENQENLNRQTPYQPDYKPSPSVAKYDVETGEFDESYDWDTHEWLYGENPPSEQEAASWSRQMVKFKVLNKLWKYLIPSCGFIIIPLTWWVFKKNFTGDISYPPFACRIFPKSMTFMGPEPPPSASEKLLAWIIFVSAWLIIILGILAALTFFTFLVTLPLIAAKLAWTFISETIISFGKSLWNLITSIF